MTKQAQSNNYHVSGNRKDGYTGRREGAKTASFKAYTQAEAEQKAKAIVSKLGGGEVKIHRPDGTIRDSDTVKPAKDPNPPKDLKH